MTWVWGVLLFVGVCAVCSLPFVALHRASIGERRSRAAQTWAELLADDDVETVLPDNDSCAFTTRFGKGRIWFNGMTWSFSMDWNPRFPEVRVEREEVLGAWLRYGSTYGQDWLETTGAIALADDHQLLGFKLGPTTTMRVQVLRPEHARVFLELGRAQASPWPRSDEALGLRALGTAHRLEGAIEGAPVMIRIEKSGQTEVELRRDLGEPAFRVVHTDHAALDGRLPLVDPVAGMTLAAFGDRERVEQLLESHRSQVLELLHGHPGSVLTEEGLTVLFTTFPGDADLLSAVRTGQAVLEALARA